MNKTYDESSNDIRMSPEVEVAKAISIDPETIEKYEIESIGTCYCCKKPIKDWGEGGIHNFAMKVDSFSYPYFNTVLLCTKCGHRMQNIIMSFLYEK